MMALRKYGIGEQETTGSTLRVLLLSLVVLLGALVGPTGPCRAEEQVKEKPGPLKKVVEWFKGIPGRAPRRWKDGTAITDPEEVERAIRESGAKTFTGNPARRTEQSNITYPLKQVSLSVLDRQIGIIRQFLSYQAVDNLKKGVGGKAWETARKVLSRMDRGTAAKLNFQLMHSDFGRNVAGLIAKHPRLASTLKKESNFFLMALVDSLITAGIYDGLDVDTMKDKVINLAPLVAMYKFQTSIGRNFAGAMVSRQLYALFNNRFDQLYEQALSSRSIWGKALSSLDEQTKNLGLRLFRGTQSSSGASFAQKIGLVGVGEGTPLRLKGLTKAAFNGFSYGVVGDVLVAGAQATVGGMPDFYVLGGDRKHYYAKADYYTTQVQRTGNKLKDWATERAELWKGIWDSKVKWPVGTLINPVFMMTGAYLGSVVAGMVISGTGIGAVVGGVLISSLFSGIGAFVGNWITTKMDRSKLLMEWRRKGYYAMIKRELRETPAYKRGELDEKRIEAIAKEVAEAMEKRETVGQSASRLLFVDDFSHVKCYREGDYWYMEIPDAYGTRFKAKGNIRYDIFDSRGHRAVFDIYSGRLIDVGRVAENNAKYIAFVFGRHVKVEGDTIVSDKESGLYVLENSVILEKLDYELFRAPGDGEEEVNTANGGERIVALEPEAVRRAARRVDEIDSAREARPATAAKTEWVVKGMGITYDIVIRETGERFAWDFDKKAFVRVGSGGSDAAGGSADADGRSQCLRLLEEAREKLAGLEGEALRNRLRALVAKARAEGESAIAARMADPEKMGGWLESLGMNDMTGDGEYTINIIGGALKKRVEAIGERLEEEVTSTADAGRLIERLDSAIDAASRGADTVELAETHPFWGGYCMLRDEEALAAGIVASSSSEEQR